MGLRLMIYRDLIFIFNSMYLVAHPNNYVDEDIDIINGLTTSGIHGLVIRTGMYMGDLNVELELRDDEPDLDVSAWDAAVIVSQHIEPGESLCLGPAFSDVPDGDLFQEFATTPGWYRVLVCAKNRIDCEGPEPGQPVEVHRIVVWPVEKQFDEQVLKMDSLLSEQAQAEAEVIAQFNDDAVPPPPLPAHDPPIAVAPAVSPQRHGL